MFNYFIYTKDTAGELTFLSRTDSIQQKDLLIGNYETIYGNNLTVKRSIKQSFI